MARDAARVKATSGGGGRGPFVAARQEREQEDAKRKADHAKMNMLANKPA